MVRIQPNKYLLSFRGKSHHSGTRKVEEKIGKNSNKLYCNSIQMPKSSQAEFIGTLAKTGGSAFDGESGESWAPH